EGDDVVVTEVVLGHEVADLTADGPRCVVLRHVDAFAVTDRTGHPSGDRIDAIRRRLRPGRSERADGEEPGDDEHECQPSRPALHRFVPTPCAHPVYCSRYCCRIVSSCSAVTFEIIRSCTTPLGSMIHVSGTADTPKATGNSSAFE